MGLLLYKSNEMFSSTELIRKSKTIFNKIIDKEIEKAIIMRDGKPGFLLMDFAKYEKIMAEFEELKNAQSKPEKNKPKILKDDEKPKKSKSIKKEKKSKDIEKDIKIDKKPKIIEKEIIEVKKVETVQPSHVIPPRPKNMDTVEDKIEDSILDDYTDENIIEQESFSDDLNEPTEEEEIKKALESIESMDFDDNMKAMAEQKIKERILIAREERAKLKEEVDEDKHDLKEELEIQVQIKEENKKKERELKEFWD